MAGEPREGYACKIAVGESRSVLAVMRDEQLEETALQGIARSFVHARPKSLGVQYLICLSLLEFSLHSEMGREEEDSLSAQHPCPE